MATILVVDDSRMSRRILRDILQTGGHAVLEAADGLAALERYALDQPDLVILDLNMAGMYGLDVLRQLRELDPHARIIVGSADIQRPTQALVQEGGARQFIAKPFLPETVLDAVTAVLAEEWR